MNNKLQLDQNNTNRKPQVNRQPISQSVYEPRIYNIQK